MQIIGGLLVLLRRLITSTTAHLISIDNIESFNSDENGIGNIILKQLLQFIYELKDGGEKHRTQSTCRHRC